MNLSRANTKINHYLFLKGITNFGIYPMENWNDTELINNFERKAEIIIINPLWNLDKEQPRRKLFRQFSKELSKQRKVFLHEASIEAGGGGSPSEAAFIYQHFQPIIEFVGIISLNLFSNYLYDVLKKLYSDKYSSITKSQFTIKRNINQIRYHYVFDGLTADQAIEASKLIPGDDKFLKDENGTHIHDLYLRYLTQQKSWIQFEIS